MWYNESGEQFGLKRLWNWHPTRFGAQVCPCKSCIFILTPALSVQVCDTLASVYWVRIDLEQASGPELIHSSIHPLPDPLSKVLLIYGHWSSPNWTKEILRLLENSTCEPEWPWISASYCISHWDNVWRVTPNNPSLGWSWFIAGWIANTTRIQSVNLIVASPTLAWPSLDYLLEHWQANHVLNHWYNSMWYQMHRNWSPSSNHSDPWSSNHFCDQRAHSMKRRTEK